MRRIALLIACVLGVLAFTPQAQAQFSPRGVFNILTSPLRGIGRMVRPPRFHTYSARRAAAARRAQRAAAARNAKPAAAAAAAAATAGAAAVASAPDTAGAKADATPESQTDAEIAKLLPATPNAFWPGAQEDLIGYIFWPGEYNERIWAHGFADIASAVFAPRPSRVADATGSTAASDSADAAKICREDAPADWPGGKITGMLSDSVGEPTLTDPQRAALKDLEKAIAEAMKSVRAACADIVKAESSARMQTMLDRLWSVRVAGYLVREPLAKFHAALTPEQRATFERGPGSADTFGMCSAASAQQLPFAQLERSIRPTKDQRAAFADLKRRFEQAALSLRASCPGRPPATPMARLDAALDRIDAITYAAGSLAPAFGEFYAGLSAAQRTRLAEFAR
jgi:hypothetical protein